MPQRTIAVVRQGSDDASGMDTGISHALLDRVGAGLLPETFRISKPGDVVAFSKRDAKAPGFRRAVEAAGAKGFGSVIRLPGGRAAAFPRSAISLSWTIPDTDPVRGIRRRFTDMASLIIEALRGVDVDASVGEIPGEYCPGEFSVNYGGRIKLAGLGQRLGRSAAHVGGVLVVGDAGRLRGVLIPVYRELGLTWDPSTVGGLDDLRPGLDVRTVADSMVDAIAAEATVVTAALDQATFDDARRLAPLHTP